MGITAAAEQATPLTNVDELRQELARWLTGIEIAVWRTSYHYDIHTSTHVNGNRIPDEAPDDEQTIYHVQIEGQGVGAYQMYHSGFEYTMDMANSGVIARRLLELWGKEYTRRFYRAGVVPRERKRGAPTTQQGRPIALGGR
jgi:hypothetical protein